MTYSQKFAGYVLGGLWKILMDAQDDAIQWSNLLHSLSIFSLDSTCKEIVNNDPIIAVLDNLISRGLPTLPSVWVEEKILQQRPIVDELGNLDFNINTNKELISNIKRALCIIEPRQQEPVSNFNIDKKSDAEPLFFSSLLPKLNLSTFAQLFEPQRHLSSILKNDSILTDQRADFVLEIPGTNLIVEIDGEDHRKEPQKSKDKIRDKEILSRGWQTLRIWAKDLRNNSVPEEKKEILKKVFTGNLYTKIIKENFQKSIWENNATRKAMFYVLVPMAIARLQKTLIHFLQCNVLSLKAPEWKIAVVERDIPCAWLAIYDFLAMVSHLQMLRGETSPLPKVILQTYSTQEFYENELSYPTESLKGITYSHTLLSDQVSFDADVLIDISMLQRYGFPMPGPDISEQISKIKTVATINSIHSVRYDATRSITPASQIKYNPGKDPKESLNYILRNLFRKKNFWPRQEVIIKRLLERKSVIALLPTGAGKSLCYQLAALLQPGITLVVDPLKALMADQDYNLKTILIDSTVFINSELSGSKKEQRALEMEKGEYQFVFIAPERLQIDKFRKHLGNTTQKFPFSYLVIDEAHCVSEWGHDFRPAYLRMAETVREHCGKDLPFAALTGTASFNVLSDVQREIQASNEAQITPEKFDRPELHFYIKPIPSDNKYNVLICN